MNRQVVYLDNAASTPIDPEVLDAMLPWLQGIASAGNPSSIHSVGRAARSAIDLARESVADLISADFSEITFTSGGTEADNLAILGSANAEKRGRSQVATTAIEHHAVLNAVHLLEDRGWTVNTVQSDRTGHIPYSEWGTAISEQTAIVACMHANNELGTMQDIRAVVQAASKVNATVHVDAVQSLPWVDLNVRTLDFDLCAISAHKIYGPKGIGALYIKQGCSVFPLLVGGSQEREKRAGTENVAAIVGFGAAARLLKGRRAEDAKRVALLRDRLIQRMSNTLSGLRIHGGEPMLPNIVNFAIVGVEGPTLLMNLDREGICASSGAACSSGSIEPSHVLRALGCSSTQAASGVRLSLGRTTTIEEVDHVVDTLQRIVERLQSRG